MTNKMGSSPPEFQPSETIRETTIGLCQFLCDIFTFQLIHKCSKLGHSKIPLAFHQEHLKYEKTLLGKKYLLQVGSGILIQVLCLFLYKHNENIYGNRSKHRRPYPSTED